VSDYLIRQNREDANYEKAYPEWLASLTPAQRAKVDKLGVGEAAVASHRPAAKDEVESSGDPANFSVASHAPDIAELVEGEAGPFAERFGCTVAMAKRVLVWHREQIEIESRKYQAFLLQRVIAGFLMPGNLMLRAGALAFAVNLAALNGLGKSIRDFAKARGFSPYGVSKVVEEWRVALELPRGPHQKSEAAGKAYSTAQKQKHWRNAKC